MSENMKICLALLEQYSKLNYCLDVLEILIEDKSKAIDSSELDSFMMKGLEIKNRWGGVTTQFYRRDLENKKVLGRYVRKVK